MRVKFLIPAKRFNLGRCGVRLCGDRHYLKVIRQFLTDHRAAYSSSRKGRSVANGKGVSFESGASTIAELLVSSSVIGFTRVAPRQRFWIGAVTFALLERARHVVLRDE